MIYPANFEVKSGFATIRSLLHQQCLVNYSHELVDSISYTSNFNQLNKLLGQVAEMKYILQFVAGFPQQDYYDLTSELIRIRVRGTYLESSTLPELKLSLEAITAIIKFISNLEPGKFNEIRNLLPIGKPEKYIIDRINKIVDEKGDIRDHASEKLSVIRKEIKSRTSSIDRRINQILGQARKDNLVNDDTELTIRNGRLVIPLPAGNKRKLKGYVHDTSATGQTVFIEPAEVFEINNDIQNLRVEEKQEIINILTEFTDFIRGYVDELLVYYRFLGEIDFIRAKAILAIDFQATKPELINAPRIEWRNAVHPILHKTLQKQGKSIVAQDISLDNNERIMVISGPNAGGKSVTLKTIALLQYMLQCGLLIPVSDDSSSGIFTKIFLEIGDEQSLENDLSTYSSHLIHIKYFLENADNQTLFLIDEFGAGTEPQLGGAMAEASLQRLNERGSFGVVTTHYTNLKLLAGNEEGLFNAAMLYDTRAMKPLFKLSIGKPGSSFAFEIANKIGFPQDVVNNASSKIGSSQLDFEKQLAQLEVDKKQIAQKTAELKVADDMLAHLVTKYEGLLNDLESKKNVVIKDARQRAQQLVDSSNKLIEKTIRDIREHQAEKEVTKQLRDEFVSSIEELMTASTIVEDHIQAMPEVHVQKREGQSVQPFILRKGSYVKMEDQDSIGVVEEVKGKRALVWFGSFKIRTSIDKLIMASQQEIKLFENNKNYQTKGISVIHDLNAKMADFRMSIDIRGKRPEEAREYLSKYIDQAILLRVHEVRILHGKGNGVLRDMVQEYLTETPEVIRIEDEKLERGGHGITVVYLQ
jgi:DNA mismatch repair protein MutS2